LPIAAAKRRTPRVPTDFRKTQGGDVGHNGKNIADDPTDGTCYNRDDFTDDCVLLGHVAGTQGGTEKTGHGAVVKPIPLETHLPSIEVTLLVDVNRILR